MLKIYEEMDINARARRLGRRMLDGLNGFAGHPLVGDVAGIGLIGGIELVQDKQTRAGYLRAGRARKVVDRMGHEHRLVGPGRTLDAAAHRELAA